MPEYFEYGEKEVQWLRFRDPVLGEAMDKIGHIDRQVMSDLFTALVNVIVGQQISAKAQATIWTRMQERLGEITPENIEAISTEELQTCGISMRKASYIKDAAGSVLDGSLNLETLRTLPDEEVCKRLSQIKGIGVWTAEMLMTFSMQRPNVMSFGDLAILRGLRMLHNHRTITPKLFEKYKRRYSPYATVASLYLWAIAGGACPELVDHAPKTEAQKKKDAKNRLK
jgi:3-methyladenine DNA glycosylase/8-oxoguanine DNA glycosylase